jgi:hypothetical protein
MKHDCIQEAPIGRLEAMMREVRDAMLGGPERPGIHERLREHEAEIEKLEAVRKLVHGNGERGLAMAVVELDRDVRNLKREAKYLSTALLALMGSSWAGWDLPTLIELARHLL